MSGYYVLLTGAKNNAGDFLIRERANLLLRRYRPDRELVDMDGWRPITDEQLEVVNGAKAILLTGGPSVRPNMRPGVYSLRSRLEDIEVPITTLGVGWRSASGDWPRTRQVVFSPQSRELLDRMTHDGLSLSVRDYHTLNVLRHAGVQNIVMTACPALYAPGVDGGFAAPTKVGRISVSIGVRMSQSPAMWRQTLALMEGTQRAFPDAKVVAVFHHSLDEGFEKAYGRGNSLSFAQRRLALWLNERGFEYVDVSGSADAMRAHYEASDLHVGYRVHAHILMTSLMRPSLLLAEDSRGSALRDVLGGHIYESIESTADSLFVKVGRRLRVGRFDLQAPEAVVKEALDILLADQAYGWARARNAAAAVENHRPTMERFIASLP